MKPAYMKSTYKIPDKQEVRHQLVRAIIGTNKEYPVFEGVLGFGSFFTKRHDPVDLDLIAVLSEYDGNWDFSPISEDDSYDYSFDYPKWLEIEEKFLSYFPHIPDGLVIVNTQNGTTRTQVPGIARIIALDESPYYNVKDEIENPDLFQYNKPNLENFIGSYDAAIRLREITGIKAGIRPENILF